MAHTLHLTLAIPKCRVCETVPNKFGKQEYKLTCSKKCCRSLIGKNVKATRSIEDENGISEYSRSATISCAKQMAIIDEETGLNALQIKSRKAAAKQMVKDPITGLSPAMISSRKSAITAATVIQENGFTIAQNSACKRIITQTNNIDPITGLNGFQSSGKKGGAARSESLKFKNAMILLAVNQRNKIDIDGKSATTKSHEKQHLTKEKLGLWVPNAQKSDLQIYRSAVAKFTSKSVRLHTIINWHLRGNKEESMHLDHKVSCLAGFLNNIPPYIIGSVHNLEMLPWKDNISKAAKCSITIDELCDKFYSI